MFLIAFLLLTTPQDIRVTVDIFSGRENPSCVLTTGQAVKLNELLQQLAADRPSEFAEPLGYRGFILEMGAGDQAIEITVYRGKVRYGDEGDERARYFADPGRRIEHFLLPIAKQQLDPGLYAYLKKELRK